MGAAGAMVVMPPPPDWSNDEIGYLKAAKTIDFATG
jgi:hypothetical protein